MPALHERVLSIVRRYWTFALPIRLLIGAFITLAAGTGLGFIAEYAAYSWSIFYGIRPPLEGIPYLKVAVTGLTVAILAGGALVFMIVFAAASALLAYLEDQIRQTKSLAGFFEDIFARRVISITIDSTVKWFRSLPFRHALMIAFLAALLCELVFLVAGRLHGNIDTRFFLSLAISIVIFLALILLWNKDARSWFALAATLIVTVGVPLAFFNTSVYGQILRFLGYGGGLPISIVVVEDPSKERNRTQVSGYLMLRTTTVLIVFEASEKRIREIPLQQVLFLDHAAIPLSDRRPMLPR